MILQYCYTTIKQWTLPGQPKSMYSESIILLAALTVAQNRQCRLEDSLLNTELDSIITKEAIWSNLSSSSDVCLERLSKITKT